MSDRLGNGAAESSGVDREDNVGPLPRERAESSNSEASASLNSNANASSNTSLNANPNVKSGSSWVTKSEPSLMESFERAMMSFRRHFPTSQSMPAGSSQTRASMASSREGMGRVYSTPNHGQDVDLAGIMDPEDFASMVQSAKRLQGLLDKRAGQFKVGDDYKVEIDTAQIPRRLRDELEEVLNEPLFRDRTRARSQAPPVVGDPSVGPEPGQQREGKAGGDAVAVAKLTICILIVGTRGDVQPFIAIGKRLMEYGHRVRLASHANYRDFIVNEGLEFYPLGGDPKVLAEYMVKNKGLLPSGPAEVTMQRKQIKAIISSCWKACTAADVDGGGGPFVADAIIANPPTMAHITVAEALQVPLHVFFTMPWTPTEEFPSPLASVVTNRAFENKLSYYVVDNLMWLGMKDMMNDLRRELRLKAIRAYHITQYHIPYGYIWSPSLAPKPHDWGPLEDVVGFCFLDLASDYKPPQDLLDFLAAGEEPIFVGFGSLPVEDPKGLTEIIISALTETKQRGVIQKGWGGLGEIDNPPENIFVLGNCPHDWLFPKCKAVIHHGGAGTTAAGLKAGCPTTVVPFFGDQFFWGQKVAKAGVGPEPVPVAQFSLEKLVLSINFMLHPEAQQTAKLLAVKMEQENGVEGAVKAFHDHLPAGFTSGSKATPWLLHTKNLATSGCCC